uniref:Arginine-hydroxylase NDUFAF5, mitochondrial n=1 Tax=Caenorhabditis tropicalis TaxID=1561998 RepID=A0A1I7UUL7_9PELO
MILRNPRGFSSFRWLSNCNVESASGSFQTAPAQNAVFDREMKRKQRDWAVRQPDFKAAQYLKEEVGWRVADKVFDLTKFNPLVLDIGCGIGHITPHLIKENVGKIIQVDMSGGMVQSSSSCDDEEVIVERRTVDEETLDGFSENQFDLLLTSMSAHWINQLPQWMKKCHEILKPDCPFIGSMLAEDTLYELRCSLQLAELERIGGVSSHISPFVRSQDVGGLLSSAGFDMITLDSDEIEVGYPNMFSLMYDLQLMAESHCTYRRNRTLRKDVLVAAEAIYQSMYAKDGKYPATFKIVSFIGWKPGPNMPKAAKRGSQTVSLKDIGKIVEDPEMMKKMSEASDGDRKGK